MMRLRRLAVAATAMRTTSALINSLPSRLSPQLPPRLNNVLSIANSINTSPSPHPLSLLDVCGDHALLPIHASANPTSPFSSFISSDISANACRSALDTIASIPSKVPVEVVNADGLEPYLNESSPPCLYVTVIAGVGVPTILSILDPLATANPRPTFPHLILSPTNTRTTNLDKLLCSKALRHYDLVQCKVNIEKERFYFALHFVQAVVSSANPRPTTTTLSNYIDPSDSKSTSCLADWTEHQRRWDLSIQATKKIYIRRL